MLKSTLAAVMEGRAAAYEVEDCSTLRSGMLGDAFQKFRVTVTRRPDRNAAHPSTVAEARSYRVPKEEKGENGGPCKEPYLAWDERHEGSSHPELLHAAQP